MDRQPQVRLAVPDMADDQGDQHILQGAVVTVVFQQGSGIINPTEAESYGIEYGVNSDANLSSLGAAIMPVFVGLSGDGGRRGALVTAVAKGVEGGEGVLFWLDTATAAVPPSRVVDGPDGVYDQDSEAVLCLTDADSNDTATCVFEVQNPPFFPGKLLWVNVQDSEGRRVGPLSLTVDQTDGSVSAVIRSAPSTPYDWTSITGAGYTLARHPISHAFVKLDARVVIQPSEVNIGDTVTVTMYDYAAGPLSEIKIGSVVLDLSDPELEIRTQPGQGPGQRSFTFVIPAAVDGAPIPLGKVRVGVAVAPVTAGDRTADTSITIAGASSDQCGETLTGDGSVSGQWAQGCDSQTSGRGHARYYRFTLAQRGEVTITLESDDADTYLYLRAGAARSGDFLYENDDHEGSTRKSLIAQTLAAGVYTIEATTYSEGETGSFTLTVAGLGTIGTAPPGPDRAALVALYNATNGPNWVNKTNWLSDEPLGEWYGVTTDGGGRVARLNLDNNQLIGGIPPELGSLSNLQWLEFGNDGFSCGAQGCDPTSPSANWLSGGMPAELGNLVNLWLLNLRGNQLSGEIPSELGALGNLRWLHLDGNRLSGEIPTELAQLANLTGIVLSFNQLNGEIPSELGNLANLQWLALSDNQLSGEIPSELGNLANLTGMLLSGNQLSGEIPAELGRLANLRLLWLRGNQLSGCIPEGLRDVENNDLDRLRLPFCGDTPGLTPTDPCGQTLSGDGMVSGQWAAGCDSQTRDGRHARYYSFTLAQQSEVTITLESDDADTYLYLRAGEARSGGYLYQNDDSPDTTRSQIQETLAAGIYTVEATTYAAGGTGRFTLTLSGLGTTAPTPGPEPADECGQTLSGDGSVSGEWAEGCDSQVAERGHARYYTFILNAESAVTITLESQDADTYLYLRAGEVRSGDFLHQNDDHQGDTSISQIREALVAGTYTIEATTFNPGETGGFTLTVAGLGATGPAPQGSDRAALIALYNATDGPNWVSKTNWLSDEPLGEWYGVTTDGGGRVTRLDLNTNQLIGEIPPELGSLSNLQRLNLSNNAISCGQQGCEPRSPSANRLSGEMPTELGDLANLRRLDLSGNKLNGEIPSELGQLANLEVLRLAGNRLSGEVPSELGDLTNLEAVELSFNRLSGEILSELGRLASLKVLEISFNQLSGEIPAELAQLANLEVLSLYNNQLSGEIPSELGDLASLEWLWLRGNQLSGEIPSELGDLPNLRSLNLSGNQSSGEIPSELGDPVNLEYLDLSGNQLSGEIPSELGNLANLQWLWLGGNQLRGEIPFTLGDLDKLELLEISSNELSGEIPSELGNLANLQWLRLGGNQLTGCIPEELRDVENNDLDRLGLPLCGDTPGLPPTAPCGQTLTGDGTVSGEWAAGCESEHRDGRHARYYSFALYQESEVTITLESGEADTYLYLREGQARSGDFLHQNDDLEAGNTNSRVTATLEAGDYTVEATTYGAGETGSFTLTVAGLGTAAGPTPSVPALWFDTESPPFDDPRVRFATSYAIDQELINEIFWDGRGDLQSPVPDALFPQWTTELDEPGVLQEWHLYDLGESRRLLAEAGYADGFETRMHVPPRWVEWAEVIAEMLAEVDIAVDVVISDPALIAALGQVSHQAMIFAPLQGFGGDVAAFIREHFTDEGQHNYSRLASDLPEEILSEFVGTEDPERRRELVYNLQNYLHYGMVLVPLPAPPASTDPCIEPLGGLATITGDWDEDACASEVPGRGYARYFSFTVAQASEVTITLESIEADTYLYLREGEDRSGEPLHENDDLEPGNTNSRITATLAAGTYTIEATTYSEGEAGSFTLTVAGLGATATTPGPDRVALIALYNATDGPNWVSKTNWLSDQPLGEWYGVTTDGGGRVTRLDLNTNRLIGEIPPELGSLPNLQWLDLSNHGYACGQQGCDPSSPSANRLSGEMPAELGDLTNLRRLDLTANQLSGEIPSELGRLANLEYLGLTGNPLRGEIPPELGSLTSLETLELSFNRLSGEMPAELGDLANLRSLDLSANQLRGEIPLELGHLASLQWLWLHNNQLSGEIPPALGSLASLEALWLHNNQLSGEIPPALGNLANLRGLNLSDNQLRGEIPAELGQLANLEELHLHNNRLSGEIPAELRHLANLEELRLYNNQLRGEIPSQMGGLANLRSLDLRSNQLSGEIPSELGDLANLEYLYLSHNQLRGEIPSELGNLANLRWLDLRSNQLSGEIPSALGRLANLEELHLRYNHLRGEIPSELGDLANLRSLNLGGNRLSGEIPSELGNLANLEGLRLSDNQLSGEIPSELGNLANLEGLRLSDNQLRGEIPLELGGLSNLEYLYLSHNQLRGEIPLELGGLSNLRWLDLRSNQLSGEIPAELGRLANLEVLSLSVNRLSGGIPTELARLANLEVLYLYSNQLSGEIPAELGRLTSLTGLFLMDNQLSGGITGRVGPTRQPGRVVPPQQPVERGDPGGVGPTRLPDRAVPLWQPVNRLCARRLARRGQQRLRHPGPALLRQLREPTNSQSRFGTGSNSSCGRAASRASSGPGPRGSGSGGRRRSLPRRGKRWSASSARGSRSPAPPRSTGSTTVWSGGY